MEQPTKQELFSFEDMRLQVGTRLQIQTVSGPNAAHYFTTLVGYVKDEYVIVKIPFENGLSVTLPQEASLIVRALSGVHVFAFSSVVERIFLAPLFYLHLSFPESIAGTVVRKALRAEVDVPATILGVAMDGETRTIDARFSNLSVTGGFIESPSMLGQRDGTLRVSFTFRVPYSSRETKIETDVTIRSVRPPGNDDKKTFGYGVSFDGLQDDQTLLIQNLVYHSLTEPWNV